MFLKPRKNRKGFTLIELIVVVAILAILAAIAVPSFIGLANKAETGVDIANASALAGAINVHNATLPADAPALAGNDFGDLTWAAIDAVVGELMPVISNQAAKGDLAAARVAVDATGVATVDTSVD